MTTSSASSLKTTTVRQWLRALLSLLNVCVRVSFGLAWEMFTLVPVVVFWGLVCMAVFLPADFQLLLDGLRLLPAESLRAGAAKILFLPVVVCIFIALVRVIYMNGYGVLRAIYRLDDAAIGAFGSGSRVSGLGKAHYSTTERSDS